MNILLSDLRVHNKFASVMRSISFGCDCTHISCKLLWMSRFLQIHGGRVTNKAYLLPLGGTQWTAMASMAEERRGPACGVVRNWATDKEEVVAA